VKLKTKFYFLLLLAAAAVTTGFGCTPGSGGGADGLEPINLSYWSVFNQSDFVSNVINDYRAIHPNINIEFRQLRAEEYEKELLNALAEDRGPDIFSIRNTWLQEYLPKIEPLPAQTTLKVRYTQTSLGIKEEVITDTVTENSITPGQVRDKFLEVVYDDAIFNNQVYGLPLAVDTLVMYYNRDLFNSAGIATPPTNWQEVQQAVKQLTFLDRQGNLAQSGIALGTGENVERSFDILSLIMMQNGTIMTQGTKVTFNQGIGNTDYNPGVGALRFYTDFATPSKEVYSWNSGQANSLQAFVEGKTAIFFGYSYHMPLIQARGLGRVEVGVAPMPQIKDSNQVNFANYWLETVSKKTSNVDAAWNFIQFATTRAEEARKYLDSANRPTALKELIEEQKDDDFLRSFAGQLLTADNWYRGKDAETVETIFENMIDSVTRDGVGYENALELAAQRVQQTY